MPQQMPSLMVSPIDMWTLLLSTIRYSLGRSTYMSSLVPELYHRYKESLTLEQRCQIRAEVCRELEMYRLRGQTMGDACDETSWQQFVDDIAKEEGL